MLMLSTAALPRVTAVTGTPQFNEPLCTPSPLRSPLSASVWQFWHLKRCCTTIKEAPARAFFCWMRCGLFSKEPSPNNVQPMYIDFKVVEPYSPHSTGLRVNSTSNKLLPNLNWNVQLQMESVQLKLACQLSTIYADPGLDLIDSSYLVLMLMWSCGLCTLCILGWLFVVCIVELTSAVRAFTFLLLSPCREVARK